MKPKLVTPWFPLRSSMRPLVVLLATAAVGPSSSGRAWGQTASVQAQPESSLQYELYYNTAARWQIDNGTRTGPEDGTAWDPTGEDFGEWNNSFGGSISYEAFQLSLLIDTATYVHRPRAADNATTNVVQDLQSRYVDVARLEFISLSYSDRDLDLTVGDFYVTLGRGMLLSIRKVADVGIDNKLRGIESRVRLGPWTVHAFTGFLNIRNYEAGQAFFYPETIPEADCSDVADALAFCADGMDLIGGARLEYRLGKYMKAGVHAAAVDVPDALRDASADKPETDLRGVGATLELPRPLRWLNAYFEGVWLERVRPNIGPDATELGRGLYGNVNLFFGKTTVLVEGKYYDNLFNVTPRGYSTSQSPNDVTANRQVINRILEPPTAERPMARILANNTAYGGRVRVDYKLTPRIVPFASGGYIRDSSFSVPTNIIFGFGGLRMRWRGGEASLNAGYRVQLNDTDTDAAADALGAVVADPGADPDDVTAARNVLRQEEVRDGSPFRNDAHVRFDVSFDVGGPYSIELFGDTFLVISERGLNVTLCADEPTAPRCINEDPALAEYTLDLEEWLEGRLSASLRSKDGWSITGAYEFYTRQPQEVAQHYPSVSGQWDFTEGGTLRFLVGGERAGLKCSGGVCRFFPGFEGGRLELALRM